MTCGEIITAIRHYLDEVNADNSHWSDSRLMVFIFEGLVDLAVKIPAPLIPKLGSSYYLYLSPTVSNYTFSEDIIKLDCVKVYGKMADLYELRDSNTVTDHSGRIPSKAKPAVVRWGETFTVYPTPGTADAVEKIIWYFTRPPTPISDELDVPEVPSYMHRWLVIFGAYRCLLEDGDTNQATVAYQEYVNSIASILPEIKEAGNAPK